MVFTSHLSEVWLYASKKRTKEVIRAIYGKKMTHGTLLRRKVTAFFAKKTYLCTKILRI